MLFILITLFHEIRIFRNYYTPSLATVEYSACCITMRVLAVLFIVYLFALAIFQHVYPISSDSSTPWRPSIYMCSHNISAHDSHLPATATSMLSAIACHVLVHLTLFLYSGWSLLYKNSCCFTILINFSLSTSIIPLIGDVIEIIDNAQ